MRTKRRSTKNSCAVAVAVGVSIAAQLQLLPNELLQIRQKCQETPTKLQGATCLMPHAPVHARAQPTNRVQPNVAAKLKPSQMPCLHTYRQSYTPTLTHTNTHTHMEE